MFCVETTRATSRGPISDQTMILANNLLANDRICPLAFIRQFVIRWISESSRWPRTVTPGESRGSRNHDDSAGSGSAQSGVRLPADEPGCSAVTGARPRGFRRMMDPVFVWCLKQRVRVSHRFRSIRLRSFKVRNPNTSFGFEHPQFCGPVVFGKGIPYDFRSVIRHPCGKANQEN